jgi:hypothetical protein
MKDVKQNSAVRVDINYLPIDDDKNTLDVDESKLSTDQIIEQGYMLIKDGPYVLQLGKFNSPIGFEKLDPPDKFQHTHSLIFENGVPENLTGGALLGIFGPFSFNFFLVNGWNKVVDDNSDKAIGSRIGFLVDKEYNLGVSYYRGDEKGSGAWHSPENLSLFDIDFTYYLFPNMIIGFEYNRGEHEKNAVSDPGEDTAAWNGFLAMTHIDFSPQAGFTIRYDTFDDSGGSRFGTGAAEKRSSLTFASTLKFGDEISWRAEYRTTSSDNDSFVVDDGDNEKNVSSEELFAVEFLYSF